MNIRWLRLALILLSTQWVVARPKDEIHPVYVPDKDSSRDDRVEYATTTQDSYLPITQDTPAEEMAPKERKGISYFAKISRASSNEPTLDPNVAKVTDQLIDAIGQMVDKDIRTPPKLKEIVREKVDKNETNVGPVIESEPVVDKVEANGKFQLKETSLSADASEGKASSLKKEEVANGVAVPVIMDEDLATPPKKLQKIPNIVKPPKDEKKKVQVSPKPVKEPPTTTPSSGLSTWILLSDNREATTPLPSKNKYTTKKPAKNQVTTVKPTTVKLVTKKSAVKTEAKPPEQVSALEALVKTQKKTPVPSRTNQKKKGEDITEKKVVTIPPAFAIDTTESPVIESSTADSTIETSTKKRKTSSKKKKKNKNRRKKPAEKSGDDQDVKDLVKQPKQPVGAQFYNFLSREIMPTVGLGLVGVLVTAGLAGLLGYNPFVGANLPVRRTYESQHGYSPNGNYYAYNSEYGDTDGGQNEEVLFREVLSGMPPEDSRYNLPQSEASYPESQLYHSQEQAYDAVKTPGKKAGPNYSAVYGTSYEAYTNKESVGKYPVYSTSGSGYYSDQQISSTTEKFIASSKYNTESTIEKQPEALYRVSSDYSASEGQSGDEETSWHRVGSPLYYSQDHPEDSSQTDDSQHSSQAEYSSSMEPGPRRLNLEKMTQQLTTEHKRSKRSPEENIVRKRRIADSPNDLDNEIDVDEDFPVKSITSTVLPETEAEVTTVDPLTEPTSTEKVTSVSEDSKQPSLIDSFPTESTATAEENPPSLMDVFRRLAQFKLRLGLSFLKASTEAFSRYLDGVQRKVEDSMANDKTLPSIKVWMGRDVNENNEKTMRVREKRYQRDLIGDNENNKKRN